MGTAILGRLGVALESLTNPGEVPLLGLTAVSSLPTSLTTQPNAVSGQSTYSGMRLLIVVIGNTATGTISVAGKDFSQAQNAVSESTPTIPVAGTAANPTGTYEYATTQVFSTVNASGVTVSGLTGGSVKIYGIQAASKLEPAMVEVEEKFPNHSPQEQRGLTSRDTAIQQLIKQVDIGKIEQVFMPDTCLWLPFVTTGSNPQVTTLPASPTVIKASTAVTSFPITSYTAQPNVNGPDSLIQLVVTGSSAVGTVTVRGTNRYGQTISEVVQCGVPGAANGNGTFYTNQAFSTLDTTTGMTATGLTSGSVAVNAIVGSQWMWIAADSGTGASSTLYTACFEWFDGTDAVAIPFAFLTETSLEGGTEKEMKWTGKGMAQDIVALGNRTTTPLVASSASIPISTSTGAFSNLWQPFDIGMPGWTASAFIDAISGTPATTAYNSVLEWKITFKTPFKPSYPAVGWNRYQKIYRQQRETDIELTVAFDDLVQYETFRQGFVKQLVTLQFTSNVYMGTAPGAIFKNWQYVFAAKIVEAKRDASKMEKVEAKFKLKTEYTPSLGYEYKLTVQNQQPPVYNA